MTLPATALILHLTTEKPKPIPKPPTQTEQFVDAPPKDVYKNNWREHATKRQEKKK